jgi:beta-N-acetylhexosaminidase
MLALRAVVVSLACGLLLYAAEPSAKTVSHKPAARLDPVVARWMRSLTLREKVAQLIVMPVYGESINTRSRVYKQWARMVRDEHVGGLIVTGHSVLGSNRNAEPYAVAALFNRMQKLAKIPLLVAADFERGASMRVDSMTPWPYDMAFAAARDLDDARYQGAETAREARALGVNWIFAPVADVNNNPDNPIINIRSYGEDPRQVANFVRAYVEGAHSLPGQPVLLTAKHFPGHGDTAEDSHMGLARLEADRDRIESVELTPFRAAIDAGIDAIMTAHMAVPAFEPKDIPATVSNNILTGLLHDELKFNGLVVTDAMDMQGLMQLFDTKEAAVRALEAGADVLLMPRNPEMAIEGVEAAIRSGRLTETRLNASVEKVLAAKERLGLNRKKLVDLEAIGDIVDSPEANERAQTVADRSVTLVKDAKDLFPIAHPENACLIALAESHFSRQGLRLADEAHKRSASMRVDLVDPKMSKADLDQIAQSAAGCSQVVVAAFVSVAAYRGNVALTGDYPDFVNALIAAKPPVILASLGNPYLARSFPNVSAYLTTYSPTPGSEIALIKALFGEIPITGHLPVTIPGLAKYGDGIQIQVSKPQKGA